MSVWMRSDTSLRFHRQARIDRICLQFEDAWQQGGRPDLRPYWLQGQPEDRQALLTALVEVDLAYRRRLGETPTPQEYLALFPHYADAIEEAFKWDGRTVASPGPIGEGSTVGRYRILRTLGQGSFGTVYLALDEELRRPVALKFPGDGQCASPDQVARLVEEIRAAAQLRHPGIVAVYDVQRLGGSRLFAVMEYVEGCTLRQYATTSRSYRRWAEVFAELAEAIGYAHGRGFVHRDLNPDNVLIDRQGHARVTDFGLALCQRRAADHSEQCVGSWAYMSPEQVRGEGERLDGRSDLWSLGVMLYECLTGQRPFRGDTVSQLTDAIVSAEPKPLRQLCPTIPRPLENICRRCLRKLPSERWQSGADLAAALRMYALQSDHPTRRTLLWWSLPVAAVGTLGVIANYGGNTPRHVELSADLLVWRNHGWHSIRDPWAIPLKGGDLIQIRLACHPPQFAYVFWLENATQITPLYPWTNGSWSQRGKESRVSTLVIPEGDSQVGWTMRVATRGHECLLVGARSTPLLQEAAVRQVLTDLPPVNLPPESAYLLTYQNIHVLAQSRGVEAATTHPVYDPLVGFQKEIVRRLSPYFTTCQCLLLPCAP